MKIALLVSLLMLTGCVSFEHTDDSPKYWTIIGNTLKQEIAKDK